MKKSTNILHCNTLQLIVYALCGMTIALSCADSYSLYHDPSVFWYLVGYILLTILLPPMQAFSDVFFSKCTNLPHIFEEGIFSKETTMFFGNGKKPVKTSDFVAKSYAETHVYMTAASLVLMVLVAAPWVIRVLGR